MNIKALFVIRRFFSTWQFSWGMGWVVIWGWGSFAGGEGKQDFSWKNYNENNKITKESIFQQTENDVGKKTLYKKLNKFGLSSEEKTFGRDTLRQNLKSFRFFCSSFWISLFSSPTFVLSGVEWLFNPPHPPLRRSVLLNRDFFS